MDYRALYFFHANAAVVLTHGLAKEEVVPDTESDRAIRLKENFEAAPQRHTFQWELKMEEKKLSSDAYQWMHDRYIKGDPEAQAFLKEMKVQAALAGQIYAIREKLGMTRGRLAEFSSPAPEAIEDLEESDYDGDWNEAIEKINRGFHHWFTNVILPGQHGAQGLLGESREPVGGCPGTQCFLQNSDRKTSAAVLKSTVFA